MSSELPPPKLARWLAEIEKANEVNVEPFVASKSDYIALLVELGHTEASIKQIQDYTDVLILQAHGHLDAGSDSEAVQKLESALKIAPWRTDLLPTMGTAYTRLFLSGHSFSNGKRARALLNYCIEFDGSDEHAYQSLNTVNRHFKKRRLYRGVFSLGAVLTCLCGWLYVTAGATSNVSTAPTATAVMTPHTQQRPRLAGWKADAPFVLTQGNITVRQSPQSHVLTNSVDGEFGLPVAMSNATPITGLSVDASESSLKTRLSMKRNSGYVKLRFSHAEGASIVEMQGLVEWMSAQHEIISAKQLTLVHPDVRLFPGENTIAHQANYDLDPRVVYAKITITKLLRGSLAVERSQGVAGCVLYARSLTDHEGFGVTLHGLPKKSLITKALFSVVDSQSDHMNLYAYPRFYDKDGDLIERASKRTIISRVTLASRTTPMLRKGESRFARISALLSPDDRRAVRTVCLELTKEQALP